MAPGRLPMTELLRLVSAYKGEIHGQDHKDQPAIMFDDVLYGYGSIPINTIFSGMNIHLPAILMFTRGTRF